MSPRREVEVEQKGFVDTQFSSGDCIKTIKKPPQEQKYQEENNNNVDGLSQDLQMGCIVDAVKRPSNICVETCIFEESDSERKYKFLPERIDDDMTQCESQESLDMSDSQRWDSMAVNLCDKETTTERETQTNSSGLSSSSTQTNITAIDKEKITLSNNAFGALVGHELDSDHEEAGDDEYSTEFEEDRSDGADSIKLEPKSAKSETITQEEPPDTPIKLSKSHSFMSTKPNGSVSGKSGRSSQYGSLPVPHTRRVNMSFSNERLREIERHNHVLLNKILSARNQKNSSIPPMVTELPKRPPPSGAVNRKKQQRLIDHENMILLRKIQRAKSSSYSIRR